MPEYKYRCEDCGEVITIRRRMSEEKTAGKCPQCDGMNLHRVFFPVGISVKGGLLTEARSCCGRDAPCSTPPCSESGVCER